MSGAPKRRTIRQRIVAVRDELAAIELELDELARRAEQAPAAPRSLRASDLTRHASMVGAQAALLHALTDESPPGDTVVIVRLREQGDDVDVARLRRVWDADAERYVFADLPPRLGFVADQIERNKDSLDRPGQIALSWEEYPADLLDQLSPQEGPDKPS